MKLKKGELTKEAFKVIMYDLECLSLGTDNELTEETSNKYHYNLLVKNLKDLFGK